MGTSDEANSPFRKHRELVVTHDLDVGALSSAASELIGDHCFRAFAVKGTAPENDDHRCNVMRAEWEERDGGLSFVIRANRFLHHMVRFLVGTMLDVAAGRRDGSVIAELLASGNNKGVSPPAPAHALYLESVEYPSELYLAAT